MFPSIILFCPVALTTLLSLRPSRILSPSTGPDFIQLRNLNMDPEYYLQVIEHKATASPLGIRNWLQTLRIKFPDLGFGYYNPALRP